VNQAVPEFALGKTPFPYPVRLRVDNPEWIEAWKFLNGYKYHDMNLEHTQEALKSKQLLMQEKGEDWPVWVLDKNAIQIGFVNISALGPGQQNPRFRWVPFADALVSPFNRKQNTYIPGTAIKKILTELHEENLPRSLENYTLKLFLKF
jgi:hypothetical protein